MKIQFCSDLHSEFEENRDFLNTCPLKAEGEILVIAGDFGYINNPDLQDNTFLKWASENFRQVLIAPGNHEFYNHEDLASFQESWERRLFPNVKYYHNRIIRFENIDFILSTLWSRIPEEYAEDIMYGMNDYSHILYNGQTLLPKDINKEYERNIDFIKKAVEGSRAEKIVVVTHHLPTFDALLGRRRNDVLNHAYASELSPYIKQSRISAWIYGHSHFATDLRIGNTRLVSNPLGYLRYGQHIGFDKAAVLEI